MDQAYASRIPTVTTLAPSSGQRSLLGSSAQVAPPPPPPPSLTPRQALINSVVNLVQSFVSAQGGAEEEERDGGDASAGKSSLLGDDGFNLTSASTSFVSKLIEEARAASLPSDDVTFIGDGDVIPVALQQRLCEGEFLRGGDGAGYNATEADAAYAEAYPLHGQGQVPVGCLNGCIVGGGLLETIARVYGVRRTRTPSAWKGKCFAEEAVDRPTAVNGTDANASAVAPWQPGSLVTNRIKLNYGVFINRLFGLTDPIELYPGKVYTGESWAAPGEEAVIIDYSDHSHEFSSFRDEIREIYPGVYLGKMYALPGTELWGGVLALPADSAPRFAINFMLFGQEGQTTMQAVQASSPADA